MRDRQQRLFFVCLFVCFWEVCQVTKLWNELQSPENSDQLLNLPRPSVRCCLCWELKQVLACSSSCRCELSVSLHPSSPSIRKSGSAAVLHYFTLALRHSWQWTLGRMSSPTWSHFGYCRTERQPCVPETTLVIATLKRAATLTMCTKNRFSYCNSERQPHWPCGPETTSVITPQRGNRIAWDIIQSENTGWVNLADSVTVMSFVPYRLETAWSVL